jgi:hypothetical protein
MNFKKLKQITAELNKTTSENIVGVGYGLNERNGKTLNEYCITFTVERKLPLEEVPLEERIPSQIEIDGVMYNTDVVEEKVELTGFLDCIEDDPVFYAWRNSSPGNKNTFRPLMGGTSVSNITSKTFSSGTMGFIAVDNEDNTLVGVSNNHVLIYDAYFATERNPSSVVTSITGDEAVQASYPDSYTVNTMGLIKKYQPISSDPLVNVVDAACLAISQFDDDSNETISTGESWKQYGLQNMTSPPRFATTSEIDEALSNPNQQFFSSGRTTGPKGESPTKLYCVTPLLSIRVSGYVKQGVRTEATINECFMYRAKGPTTPEGDWCISPIEGGDSGSAILTVVNGEYVIIGLAFAGGSRPVDGVYKVVNGYGCRIDNIATALNIRAWDGSLSGIGFSDTANTETYILEGLSEEKAIIRNGKTYWQAGITTELPTV